jgi:tetratricopeptide (TPR) repeat protein
MSDSPEDILSQAVRFHQSGDLQQAQKLYQQVLDLQPQNPDALHLLGFATYQSGNAQAGLLLIHQAIAINPSRPDYHTNLGVVLAALNQHGDAVETFRHALLMRPKFAEAFYNLGLSLKALDRNPEAIEAYQAALAAKPDWLEALINLGNSLMELEEYSEAAAEFEKATKLNPDSPPAWFNLGNAYLKLERFEDAIAAARRAVAAQPIYPEAYNNIGTACSASKRPEEALSALLRAVEQKPDYAEAFSNLSSAYDALKKFPESIAAARRALELDPSIPQAHANLARSLLATENTDEAITEYRRAIELDDNLAEAHYNLGMILLRKGEYHEAWKHYEWRWDVKEFKMDRAHFVLPAWNGEDLRGRTILIHIEQGFGDLIQFARYVPLVAQRGGKVYLESFPELGRLMESVPGVEKVVPPGPTPPQAEIRCPMLSLPRIFDTTLQTIPTKVPYLWFNPQLAQKWREKIDEEKRLKVGLVWNGRPRPEPKRSVPINQLAPLAAVKNVRFISLQFGEAAGQIKDAPPGLQIEDWTTQIADFSETAALMANLDLIITIDTAAAHLAGALARPTWVMLCHRADWRWTQTGSVCPWYPTMRLFRQPTDSDWQTPLRQLAAQLADLAKKKS